MNAEQASDKADVLVARLDRAKRLLECASHTLRNAARAGDEVDWPSKVQLLCDAIELVTKLQPIGEHLLEDILLIRVPAERPETESLTPSPESK